MASHRIAKRTSSHLATAGASPNTLGIVYDTTVAGLRINDGTSRTDAARYLSDGQVTRRVGTKTLSGADVHAGTGGVVAWTNPEAGAILILRTVLDLTTTSAGACTLDIGVTETSAVTSSDTLLDGIDANAAVAVFDSMNAALDSGANAKAQKLAGAKWVTIDEKTGDATGLVGVLYVEYVVV